MTRESWQQVKELFDQALPLGPEERRVLLDAHCNGAGEVRQEVEALLATPEPGEDFLERPAMAGAVEALEEKLMDALAGQRLGPFEVGRRIGTGGTSTVYEAWRRDGHYEQRVAIKVVRPGMDSGFILLRLQAERQILAGLSHPNIARILDGGATPSGAPYMVMEFIDGLPITEYCDRNVPGIRERLEMFEQVCAAVQHAHSHLVVHRDIKPGNVVVTADGVPKLLDFGIAKLLDQGRGGRQETLPTARMLTPEYASPEQVLGEPITTATDVYSLGVLLYELLTGRRPYGTATDSPLEMAKAVCETQPERPSTAVTRPETTAAIQASAAALTAAPQKLRRVLAGDLDNIVLKALRKEPERRYASVEQFASDIRRYLEGRPVLARKDTLGYRTTKFVRRNVAACVAVVLLVLAIAAGAGATFWQARVANRERARAERRFNEVRVLGRSTLFELEAAIRKLPGSLPVRALLVERAVQLLDGLSKDTGNDEILKLELANGYRRLARIQGNAMVANLGNRMAAADSSRKAIALAESVVAARPRDPEARSELASAYFDLALALSAQRDREARTELLKKSIQIAEALVAEYPDNPVYAMNLVASYQQRGTVLGPDQMDLGAALLDQRRALALAQKVIDAGHVERERLSSLSSCHKRVGAVLIKMDRLPEALNEYHAALALDERILAMDPQDPAARYDITLTRSDIGFIYGRQGDIAKALESYRQVLAAREALLQQDPQNARVRQGVSSTCKYLSGIAWQQGNWKGTVTYERRSVAELTVLVKTDPSNTDYQTDLAQQHLGLGKGYAMGAKTQGAPMWRQAADSFRTSLELFDRLKSRNVTINAESREDAAKSLAEAEAKLKTVH
jgi:serine/threonine protein kinase